MTYIPEARQLEGLSLPVAECYGKPHIDCYYKRDDVKSHQRMEGAKCVCCGAFATNAHHCPPLSKGHVFLLRTPVGRFVLKPALFAVCGSGTTGCHNGFHGGARYKAEWVWMDDEWAERWWQGDLLKVHAPHDKELFSYGYWRITDKIRGIAFSVRQ